MKSKTLIMHFTNTFGLRLLYLLKYQVLFELKCFSCCLNTMVSWEIVYFTSIKRLILEFFQVYSLSCIICTNIDWNSFLHAQWLLEEEFIQMYYSLLHGFVNFYLLYFACTVEEFLQIYFTSWLFLVPSIQCSTVPVSARTLSDARLPLFHQ